MIIKKIFLSIYIALCFAITFAWYGFFLFGIFAFEPLASNIANIAADIMTGNGVLVTAADILNNCKTALLALLTLSLVLAVVKTYISCYTIKYAKYDYIDLYRDRYKFLGLVAAHFFTGTIVLDTVLALLSLLLFNRKIAEKAKDLSKVVEDVKSDTYSGGKVDAGKFTVNIKTADDYTYTASESMDLSRARQLYENGLLTKRQFKKIEKDLNKKK